MWEKIKLWFLKTIKKLLLSAIDSLDKYEDDIAELIAKHADPDETAKMVVDHMQDKMKQLAEKVFAFKWFHKLVMWDLKVKAMNEIDQLNKYESVLADLIRKHLDPEDTAEAIVDFVQDHLRKLVEKNI